MSGHVDASSLFREINDVFKRYGVGKGVGFVPDRLEMTMDRAASGACTLIYQGVLHISAPRRDGARDGQRR